MAIGVEDRLPTNGILIFGFILIAIGMIVAIGLTILLIIKDSKEIEKILTIGGIVSGLSILVGGLNESNSALGFTQGNWGIKAGNILVPVFALVTFICSYPSACVILHRKDQEDKLKNL